jgi:hypothetical protein
MKIHVSSFLACSQKYTTILLTLAALLSVTIESSAQIDTSSFKYPKKIFYTGGIVFKLDGSFQKLKRLNFNKTSNLVSGYSGVTPVSYHLLDIEKIKVKKGSEAWIWALIVGTATASFANVLVNQGASPDLYLLGVVGAGIGLTIGFQRKSYKLIYDNGYFIH